MDLEAETLSELRSFYALSIYIGFRELVLENYGVFGSHVLLGGKNRYLNRFVRYKIAKIDPFLAKQSIILTKSVPETNINR